MEHLLLLIGQKDKHGHNIKAGDLLLSDEAGWKGIVVWRERQPDEYGWVLIDTQGGFSLYPNWNKCEIFESYDYKNI